jgi:3-(3-hydroxy-phenyl)propionate hydroxylase
MAGHRGDWELEWWSIYTANTLCLDDYRHQRVLFIGDSGHIVPIFGVRGLNNGIADAMNAAWKLAWVLKGLAPDALLDSYTPERRGATLDVFRNAGKSSRFMTPPSRGYALLRKAVLELALTEEFTRPFADPRQVQPYTYAHSLLTTVEEDVFSSGPGPGASLLNHRLAENNYLLDHLGSGFNVLCFSDKHEETQLAQTLGELRALDPECRLLRITRDAGAGENVLQDEGGDVYAAYGAQEGTLYLVRPDRHVAGRWKAGRLAELVAALQRALGGQTA